MRVDAQRNHDDDIDRYHDADDRNREQHDHAARLLARELLVGEKIHLDLLGISPS